ncbi:hypothetical protein YC2023_069242 [Brassica napus]
MEEGVKDNAASPPKPRLTSQSRALLSTCLLKILLLFLVLSLGISVCIYMIKFLEVQHLDHVAPTTLISMYDQGAATLESFIRPPLNDVAWGEMSMGELIVNGYVSGSTYIFMGCADEEGPDGRGRYINGMEPEITLSQWRKGSQWFEINRKLALEIEPLLELGPKILGF